MAYQELLAAVLFKAGDAKLRGRVLKAASLPSVTVQQQTSRTRGLQLSPEQWNQGSLHRPPAAQGRAEGSRRKVMCISVPPSPGRAVPADAAPHGKPSAETQKLQRKAKTSF